MLGGSSRKPRGGFHIPSAFEEVWTVVPENRTRENHIGVALTVPEGIWLVRKNRASPCIFSEFQSFYSEGYSHLLARGIPIWFHFEFDAAGSILASTSENQAHFPDKRTDRPVFVRNGDSQRKDCIAFIGTSFSEMVPCLSLKVTVGYLGSPDGSSLAL